MAKTTNKIALFTGSFDPITKGHISIVKRSLNLFDNIVVCILKNSNKKSFLSKKDRIEIIEDAFKNTKKVTADFYDGLAVEYAKKIKATAIIRGIRNNKDFEEEKNMALINKNLERKIETFFLVSEPKTSFISSSLIRELAMLNKDISKFVTIYAKEKIEKKIKCK